MSNLKELPSPADRANCPTAHRPGEHCFRMVNKFNRYRFMAGRIVESAR